jgi:SHS2 domain-containing protein
MPYRFLEEVALADVAFEAAGKTLEELFASAAEALLAVMVNPEEIKTRHTHRIGLKEKAVDRLLYTWLSELIFLKDSEGLLFRQFDLRIREKSGLCTLAGTIRGEKIDRKRHVLLTDVKAVTMHLFEVAKTAGGWKATVVLDI